MMERFRPTVLEVNLSALARNFSALAARLPAHTKTAAVVKADAYGLGAVPCAQTLLRHGADFLAVAIPEEGAELRQAGISAPILVLGAVSQEGAEAAVRWHLTQTVFEAATVAWLEAAASRAGREVDVHLKVDSGMGRIGVRGVAEAMAVCRAVQAAPHVRLTGVFTHFAASDAASLDFTRMQNARFQTVVEAVRAECPGILVHAANSATQLRCPELSYDMVRAGIAMYTRPDFPGMPDIGLGETVCWKTRAAYVKTIEAGESVGYGCAFTAEQPTRVMTLPVGYADGYHRAICGRGWALVRGQRAPVIGRVCMDQAMLDVTGIPGAAEGDEVVLLGAQGRQTITPREMGAWCGMIDYEILLSPTGRVPRVYV